ncbi:hypothetical protein HA402_015823 [Bradysia odoriphaga]|nr:hypothetical protein HA402_015823 [Bradysia odoriphaga]
MVGRRLPKPKPGLKIHLVYDKKGKLFLEFQVGPHGRVEWVRVQLRIEYLGHGSAPSNAARVWVQAHGAAGDQAGHIFPACAGFAGNVPYNIFIQNGNFNQGVCSKWDQVIKHALESGKEGFCEVEFEFPSPTNPRPYQWHEHIDFVGGFSQNDTVENPVGSGNSMKTGSNNYEFEEGRCSGCKEFKWTDRYDKDGNGGSSASPLDSNSKKQPESSGNGGSQSANAGNGGSSRPASTSGNSTSDSGGFKPVDLVDLIPVVGTIKVGADAIGAFCNGNVGTGLAKTALCGISAVGDVCMIGGLGKVAVKGGSLVVSKTAGYLAQGGYVLGFLGRNLGRN